MRYLSVCSGIEAATVAFAPLGWTPLAMSEIDPFPRAVLQHHYPDVPLYGDFTELRHQPWIVDADVLVGGTPCQSFSVAGLRGSLSDARGNLALEFIRLANAIDDLRRAAGRPPAFILWENVPGVLSTADNAFGSFLGGMVGSDAAIVPESRWADAGVVAGPERVAAWRCLDAQHFGLAQRRKRVFVLALGGPRGWACADALLPIIASLSGHPAPRREPGQVAAPSLTVGSGGSSGHRYGQAGMEASLVTTAGAQPGGIPDLAKSVRTPTGGMGRIDYETDVASRRAASGGSSRSYVGQHMAVRRLTPRECARLQGFPDTYLDIVYRGKPAADGNKYKALGNSMAVPVMQWIGKRIQMVEELP